VNFEPLRRLQSKLSVAFIAAAALVLTSCGGGGATSSPNVGSLQLLPGTASIYAGVPVTLNIVGGRAPYLVTSSEPTLVELNFTTSSNNFTFIARNPGVVDVGLDPDEVPRRTVNIEVRDSNGVSISNAYNVLQNFFTGYGESYVSTCATSSASTGPAPQACSGADTLITLIPVSNGNLYGNRLFQFDKVRGDFQFVVEDPAVVPQLVNRISVRTDQNGRAFVRVRVTPNAPTQLATYKLTDVSTGVTTDLVFLIVQLPSVDTITVLPSDTFTFQGALSTQCGSGSGDLFVNGGTPPYSVTASSGVSLSTTTLANAGDRLSFSQPITAPPCQNGTIIIRDTRGASATVTIEVTAGSGTGPALTAVPNTIASLLCGQSVQVSVVGGLGGYSATSAHPRITATVLGNVLTLTRLSDGGVGVYPTSGSATVTDGTSAVPVTITATPATCP
jgi:hypothetical protein